MSTKPTGHSAGSIARIDEIVVPPRVAAWTKALAALSALIAAGCCAVIVAPTAAASGSWCAADLGGSWDAQVGVCSASVVSNRDATMDILIAAPTELMDDPTMGPTIRKYVSDFAGQWRATGATMARDSIAKTEYIVNTRSDSLKSVVFREFWQTVGVNPNNAYRTWTFDVAHGQRLALADLVQPGIDPLVVIPPLARPYLTDALDQAAPPHLPGTYPFTAGEWEPRSDGAGFSSDYRAFALTDQDLILYMPDGPIAHPTPRPRDQLVWSMDGGATIVKVPLAALTSILRLP